jgi:hypothetical protein
LKFCKNCGLPVAQLTTYVSTGGTAPLMNPPPSQPQYIDIKNTPEGIKLRQQKVLTLLGFIFSLPAAAIIGANFGLDNVIAPLAFFGMIIGIVWTNFHFKAKMRLLEQKLQQQQSSPAYFAPQQPMSSLPQPGAQAWSPALPPSTPQQIVPPPTNPLQETPQPRPSVVEDETQRLPPKKS